ncbi:hypothetical protein GGR57DRAFT_458298 [Xylariaceae sp. FL1272]|nr:hypothetical protein GGR57DRAFT_458298 [Xylariaceae sp. FL1272]
MPQSSSTPAHEAARTALGLSVAPGLVYPIYQQQKQYHKKQEQAASKPRSTSAASIYSQDTTYSYDKSDQHSEKPKSSMLQRIKNVF